MSKASIVTYTTSPAEYDYGSTFDHGVVGRSNGKPVRKVSSPERVTGFQRDRYMSGLGVAWDTLEFRKLVRFGLVEVTETERVVLDALDAADLAPLVAAVEANDTDAADRILDELRFGPARWTHETIDRALARIAPQLNPAKVA